MGRPQFTEIQAHLDAMDMLPLRALCAFCGWQHLGTAREAREKASQHRAEAHPDVLVTRRKPRGGHLKSFRQPKLKSEDWEEILHERDKRAKLHGVEIQDP